MARHAYFREIEGVVMYRVPQSRALVVLTHYIADPLKRSRKWEEQVASDSPEGKLSREFQEEYDLNFEAKSGEQIYHAFNPSYSLVPPFDPMEHGYTRWRLGFDFGDKTAVIFVAQHPKTQQMVVFDECYFTAKETHETMQQEIYATFAKRRGLAVGSFQLNDYVEDVVGDPHGAGLARMFGQGELGIEIRCTGWKTAWKIDDHRQGWKRVNDLMSPGFWCCGKRQHPKGYAVKGKCALCGNTRDATPLLVIMEGRAENLCRTLPEQTLVEAIEGLEQDEKEAKGLEDHLTDALRYLCATAALETPPAAASHDVLTMPVTQMTVEDMLHRYRLEAAKKVEVEKQLGIRDEQGMVMSLGTDENGRPVIIGDEDEADVYVPGLDGDEALGWVEDQEEW